jgi:hypothetical protein
LGYIHKINQKNQRKSLTFCNSIIYEINRDAGNLPEHDIEFQAETGIGPVYNNGRPLTRDEQREALEEDGRMTPAEIEEWLDSLEM